MTIVRVIVAIVLTVAMLYIARTNSRGQPEYVTAEHDGYTFEMTTVPKITEFETDTLRVGVTPVPAPNQPVEFRTNQDTDVPMSQTDDYRSEVMRSSKPGEFYIPVTAGDRGGRFYYYFEVYQSNGLVAARFMADDNQPFLLKYIGEVPGWVLGGHLLFIFATVFCIAMATIHAFPLIRGSADTARAMMVWLFWGMLFSVIGCYPFGIPMNYYAFNGYWEGVPFGHDATDNKTQLLVVYLIFAVLAGLGTLTRGKLGRDIFSMRGLGWVGIGSFAVMLFIYLIPHSIQFSPALTYWFCYSWIGAIALLYLIGWFKGEPSASAA